MYIAYILGAANSEQAGAMQGPPTPMFGYHDITIGALTWLALHIQVNPSVSCCSTKNMLFCFTIKVITALIFLLLAVNKAKILFLDTVIPTISSPEAMHSTRDRKIRAGENLSCC